MDVIKTATAVADKFGPGLNGFRSESPGLPATQLSPEWADSVQMELVNAITSQGLVLDGMVFTQLQEAIDSWAFAGDPSITSGHNLTIESGAMLLAASGGTIETQSGSGLVLGNGSTLAVQANVTLSASDNTWVWGSSDNNDWTINGNVTLGTSDVTQISLIGDVSVGFDAGSTNTLNGTFALNDTITGGGGTLVSVESIEQTIQRWVTSGTTLPSTTGYNRWNGTFYSLRDGNGQVRTFEEPVKGYDAQHVTSAGIEDTTCGCIRRIKENENVFILFNFHAKVDAASQDVSYRIKVTGPLGTAEIVTETVRTPTVANTGMTIFDGIQWKPTDTWPAEVAEQSYSFLVRVGVTGGNTLTADRIMAKVSSAVQV